MTLPMKYQIVCAVGMALQILARRYSQRFGRLLFLANGFVAAGLIGWLCLTFGASKGWTLGLAIALGFLVGGIATLADPTTSPASEPGKRPNGTPGQGYDAPYDKPPPPPGDSERARSVYPLLPEPDLQEVPLGMLRVPSGRLEAADPLVNLGRSAVILIKPGTYPVRVLQLDTGGGDIRPAALMLDLSDERPQGVVLFRRSGQPVALPYSGSSAGVLVDSGTVSFADRKALAHGTVLDDEDVAESWIDELEEAAEYPEGMANIDLPGAPNQENLVMCASGWGDGVYPVVGVVDAVGQLVRVVIDLGVQESGYGASD